MSLVKGLMERTTSVWLQDYWVKGLTARDSSADSRRDWKGNENPSFLRLGVPLYWPRNLERVRPRPHSSEHKVVPPPRHPLGSIFGYLKAVFFFSWNCHGWLKEIIQLKSFKRTSRAFFWVKCSCCGINMMEVEVFWWSFLLVTMNAGCVVCKVI